MDENEYYLDSICIYCLNELFNNHFVKLKKQSQIDKPPRINFVCTHIEVKE